MAPKKSQPKSVYQLKVTLKDINPPIWRRLLVSPSATLFELHEILQLSMGWMDSHLHEFTKDAIHYSPPDPEADRHNDILPVNSKKTRLSKLLSQPGDKMDYLYDFGDGWEHEILLEGILMAEPGKKYPLCLAGARSCPPEDCGSTPGYEDLVKAMRDPKDPERERFLEWLDGPYDPEAFNLENINSDLENFEEAWARKLANLPL